MSYEVTGLVIAKNEAQDLPKCLSVLTELCDTTLLIDNESTDETPAIAKSFGAFVITAAMSGEYGYSGLRNLGLESVQTSHVLILDADERPDVTLAVSLESVIARKNETAAYQFVRRNNVFGKWLDHGRFGYDVQTRLFPSDTRYDGIVHEAPQLDSSVEQVLLDGKLEHYTYETVREYIEKMRNYSAKEALQLTSPPSAFHMLAVPLHHLLVKEGYKDGWRGFVMAAGDGWYDHLIRVASKKI